MSVLSFMETLKSLAANRTQTQLQIHTRFFNIQMRVEI